METKKVNQMKFYIFLAVVIGVLYIVFHGCLFSVSPNEYVVVKRFGKVVSIEKETGLHAKLPFVDDAQSISAKMILYDIPASDVITKDKKSMITDTYVIWKVSDPLKYLKTLNAINERAEERIEASVYNATKNAISSMDQDEVIEARGEALMQIITKEAREDMDGYGIEIVQAQIKALDLPDDNKAAVYDRMISERNNIAASFTAEGKAEAQKIKNETDKEVVTIKANAQKDAEKLKAEGEAEYMKTLKKAYDSPEKADFYNYLRGLDMLKKSLKGNKTIILDKNSELARILYGK